VKTWVETYEHAEFGEIMVIWQGERDGLRSFLIAIQADLWTPPEEVDDCLKWARDLQHGNVTRGGDAGTPVLEA